MALSCSRPYGPGKKQGAAELCNFGLHLLAHTLQKMYPLKTASWCTMWVDWGAIWIILWCNRTGLSEIVPTAMQFPLNSFMHDSHRHCKIEINRD